MDTSHLPQDHSSQVAFAARELSEAVALKIGELADRILGRPELGTPEWMEEHAAKDTAAGRQRLREWHLVKMAIRREAALDYTGDVLNARAAGASWEAIGLACGMTAEAAEERWSKLQHLAYPYTSVGTEKTGIVHTALGGEDLG